MVIYELHVLLVIYGCYSLSFMLNIFVTNVAGTSSQDKGKAARD